LKDFTSLSGPWLGWSIQDGIRISERIRLTIVGGKILGTGIDKDGEFELVGAYIVRQQKVILTRTYTVTTLPSQEGVGIPYDYDGVWDGMLVSGLWHPRFEREYGGPFEMWPADDDGENLLEQLREETLVGSR
jgi:hypothetical protein